MQNLLLCAHTLCMSDVTNTFLLVRSSVRSKQLLYFVHGQGQKSEPKPTTKNFVWFHNHAPLLTMIVISLASLVGSYFCLFRSFTSRNGQTKSIGTWNDLISKCKGLKKLNLERLAVRLGLTTVNCYIFFFQFTKKNKTHNS